MKIDPGTLSRHQAYRLFISTIVPRPIAWISSLAADGSANLAPFSFFMGVTSDPPTLAVAIGRRAGTAKDSARNILATGEFVVNVVTRPQAEAMVLTSGDFAPEIDEFEESGLDSTPSDLVRPPRVAGAPVAMECRLERSVEIGRSRTVLVIGEVLRFHVDDDLWTGDEVLVERLEPVGRLGGALYAPIKGVLEIARPQLDKRTGRLKAPQQTPPPSRALRRRSAKAPP